LTSRSRACVVVFAGLAAAGPVAAQPAERVAGGGSFNDAPVLDTGRFKDTIRLRETLYYAIELQIGEGYRVRARVVGDRGGPSDTSVSVEMETYDFLREPGLGATTGDLQDFDGRETTRLSAISPEVDPDEERYAQPGAYFFSVRMFSLTGEEQESPIKRFEYPMEITIRRTGAPAPTPTPTEEESPPASPRDAAAADDEDSTDGAVTELIRWGLVALLAGAVAGAAIEVARGRRGRG
jgi:hypothetical protein